MHGYANFCNSGKCNICNTPWPKLSLTPTTTYLQSIGYYEQYINLSHGIFPKGMTGQEVLDLRKKLDLEYKRLEGKLK